MVGDELRFYYLGRNGLHSSRWKFEDDPKLLGSIPPFRGALGVAVIQRDRFVAMEGNYRPGVLRTKLLVHEGGMLHLNAAAWFGVLGVSVLDQQGALLEKVTLTEIDAVDIPVPALAKFSAMRGQPVRLEFSVQDGRLFSFWVE